jgi:hypothetical protein
MPREMRYSVYIMASESRVLYVTTVEIDDRKWESLEDKAAGSVQMFGPSLWRLGNVLESVLDISKKRNAHIEAPGQVPFVGGLQFKPRFRM